MSENKLVPPSPAPEPEPIPAAEPVEQIEESSAISMLRDLPAEAVATLDEQARTWLDHVTALNPHSQEFGREVQAIRSVAREAFESTASTSSRFMESSLKDAKSSGGETSEQVAQTLVDLRTTMEGLAPGEKTFAQKALGWLPGGNSAKRYFRQYESNQDQLNGVLAALSRGQEGLQRDNAELAVERRSLWADLETLQKAHVLLSRMDEAVVGRIADERAVGKEESAGALEKDVLFAIRQRHQDVQTQIAVTVQGYLAMGLIEDNNLKLIDGVDRARTTTVTALRTAVITAQALENQKLVLDQIDAVNRTTNDLIDRTSELLASNTARIQEQAVNSGVEVETLQRAFDTLFTTMDQVDQFRLQANENFAKTIGALDAQVQRAQPYLERSRGEAGRSEEVEGSSARDLLSLEPGEDRR